MSSFYFVVCLHVMGNIGFYFSMTLALLSCLCWMFSSGVEWFALKL